MTHRIRPAAPHDADALFALATDFATSFRPERAAFDAALAELLPDPSARLLAATIEDRPRGYLLGFDHATFFANGRVAWVEELMVDAALRRAGVGRALMAAFETWARRRGCRLVTLATRRAAPFYAALGYERSATYFRRPL